MLAGTAGTVAGVVLLSGWLLLRTRGDTSSPEALAGPRAAASLPVSTPSPDRPEGLRDVLTGVSFPYPGPRWDDEPLPGPHNAAVVADHWACEYDRCYHGMIASGGPVAGTDLRAFALREGDELHVKYVGKLRTETRLASAATTVAGHPAWQARWRVVPADPDGPAATAWLLAIDGGGGKYDWIYGVVDDGDPNLTPSTFDTVLRTIAISRR